MKRGIVKIGEWVSWLNLVMVMLTFAIVVCRYVFRLNWVWLQELVLYFHACVFMLAGAYTLLKDHHVKVDILSSQWSSRTQLRLQKIGVVFFLIPFCSMILFYSYPYVMESWKVFESSGDANGLPGVFLLKTLLLIYPILLLGGGVHILLSQQELDS